MSKKKKSFLKKIFETPSARIQRLAVEKNQKAARQKAESRKELKRTGTHKDGSTMPDRYFKNKRVFGMRETKGGKGRKKPNYTVNVKRKKK